MKMGSAPRKSQPGENAATAPQWAAGSERQSCTLRSTTAATTTTRPQSVSALTPAPQQGKEARQRLSRTQQRHKLVLRGEACTCALSLLQPLLGRPSVQSMERPARPRPQHVA